MKTSEQIIKEKINWDKSDLRFASVKYFAESGKLSGSLFMAIKEAMEEYKNKFIQQAASEAWDACESRLSAEEFAEKTEMPYEEERKNFPPNKEQYIQSLK